HVGHDLGDPAAGAAFRAHQHVPALAHARAERGREAVQFVVVGDGGGHGEGRCTGPPFTANAATAWRRASRPARPPAEGTGPAGAQERIRKVTPYMRGAPRNALKVLKGLPGSGNRPCSGPSKPTWTYSSSVMLVPHSSSIQRLSLEPMPKRAFATV